MHICRFTGSRAGFELMLNNSMLIDSNQDHWFTHTFTRKGNNFKGQVYWANCPPNMILDDPKNLILHIRGLPCKLLTFEFQIDFQKDREEDQLEAFVYEKQGITNYALGEDFKQDLITKYLEVIENQFDNINVHDYKPKETRSEL